MFPARTVAGSTLPRPKAMAEAVVDFPFDPVTPMIGFFARDRKMERSVSMGMPRDLAASRNGEAGGTAGFLMTRSVPVKSCSSCFSSTYLTGSPAEFFDGVLEKRFRAQVRHGHLGPVTREEPGGCEASAVEPQPHHGDLHAVKTLCVSPQS